MVNCGRYIINTDMEILISQSTIADRKGPK